MEKGLQTSVQMLAIVGLIMVIVFAWIYVKQLHREVSGLRSLTIT